MRIGPTLAGLGALGATLLLVVATPVPAGTTRWDDARVGAWERAGTVGASTPPWSPRLATPTTYLVVP